MNNPVSLPNRAEIGSLSWRRARGLITVSDFYIPTQWNDKDLISLPKRQPVKPAIPIKAGV